MRGTLVLALGWLLFALRGDAQIPPMPPEFQVNSYTTGNQYGYGLAMDRRGDFVVTWDSAAQDGNGYGTFAQRYDAAAAAQGDEFQVNSYTIGNQAYSSSASSPAGTFVVVWESGGQDGDSGGIFGQRFGVSGTPLGSEFPANAYTTGNQTDAFVATDAGGNFVVVWNSLSRDGSGSGVFAQRFDNTGQPVGSDFQVNTYTTGYQIPSGVAMDAAGDFVIVWGGYGPLGTSGVFARRFDKSGTASGDPVPVNTGSGFSPAVAMDRSGEFVVAWEGSDGAGAGVVARRFDATGTPVGSQFTVNTYTTSDQLAPSIGMDGSGNFVVAWQSYGQDGDDYGIFARRYDRFGAAVSSEFAVNSYTTGYQAAPRVATSDTGSFVVSWQDGARDGSGFGVFARRAALSAGDSFAVDPRSGAGLVSNANGVLEPGETVAVEPAWKNTGDVDATFTGAASALTGPAGATYTLSDAAADYGTVPAGGSASCHGATGDCYAVAVSDPAIRPATHWDVALQENLALGTPKTWILHVGKSFDDVPVGQPFYRRIESLLHSGITAGCTARCRAIPARRQCRGRRRNCGPWRTYASSRPCLSKGRCGVP